MSRKRLQEGNIGGWRRIGQGQLQYVLTSLGEKFSDEEMNEILEGVQVTRYVSLSRYRER